MRVQNNFGFNSDRNERNNIDMSCISSHIWVTRGSVKPMHLYVSEDEDEAVRFAFQKLKTTERSPIKIKTNQAYIFRIR